MKIQGVRLQGTKLVPSGAAVVESDTYFNLVALLLPGNGTNGAQNNTFLDSSTNAFTITRNGNPTQGTFSPFSQTGWSNYFDGTGDYLSVGTTQLWTPSNDLTIEGWFNISTTGDRCIFSKDAGSSGPNRGIIIYITSTGAVSVFYSVTGSSEQFATSSTGLVVANQWYHIAVVKNGSSCAVYLNGVSVATFTAATIACPASQINYIGAYNGGAFLMLGYISNLRLVNGTAVYTSAFTPPTAPLTAISGTSLLTCQSNRFIDNSTNAFAITVSGNPSIQAFSPFDPTTAYAAGTVGGSGYFDGSGDYLDAGAQTAFAFGTGSWTVEAWVYVTSLSSEILLFDTRSSVSTAGVGCRIGTDGTLSYSGSANNPLTSTAIKTNEWNHIAWSYDGTTLSGYINGVRGGTATPSFNISQNNGIVSRVGFTAASYMSGYISSLRVVKGSAVYSGTSFSLPTAPLTAISGTSLLLSGTNGGITDATAKNVLETVGGAAISTAQSKWGGSSMAFDGSGDYLTLTGNPTNFAFGTGDFTIEMWLYANSVADAVFYDGRPASTNGAYPMLYFASGILRYYANSADRITSTVAVLSASTWYHIALCRSGTSTKLFLDGVQIGSTYTDSTNYLNTGNRPWIGVNASTTNTSYLNGYIDDLRITKGYARYTTNFTPPTTAFPTQ